MTNLIKKIAFFTTLAIISTAVLADDGFSFYGGISKTYASGAEPWVANNSGSEIEGSPWGYFAGVDYTKNQYFMGLEANILQPHCQNDISPCGADNMQGIHEPDSEYYNFIDLKDIKVRLGTELKSNKTKLYLIGGISTGVWDDDTTLSKANATLVGVGAEVQLYEGLRMSAERIQRTSNSGSEYKFNLNSNQLRLLYRF